MDHPPLTRSWFQIRDTDSVRDSTVADLLAEAARACPDAPALIETHTDGRTGRRWTFATLQADALALARVLASRHAPGERVCVWAPNIPEWVLMEYACAQAGLVLVTANPAYQVAELGFVLAQSRAVALYHVAGYRGNPMDRIAASVCADSDRPIARFDLQDPVALNAPGPRAPDLPMVRPGDPVQIQYTSGTTGFPKGAVLTHRGITNNARFYAARTEAPKGAPWSCYMPLFHTAGCGMTILGAVQMRAPVCLIPQFDPAIVLSLLESERIAVTGAVPTMLVAMLDVLQHRSFDLSALSTVICGGSMVAPDLVRAVGARFGCPIQTVYGQTETSPLITQHLRSESEEVLCSTIGTPLPQTEVSIRSTDKNEVQAIGATGEICVRGYLLMAGYNDNPTATAATIDPEGWLHTGDLGTMDATGRLRITGRVKEMIIRGGENLFPAEIENVLLDHPDIAEVAVVGIPDPTWGEVVAAFLRPRAGAEPDPVALKSHCRAHLAPMKTPTIWCLVDAFPFTGSGKIQKFALRDKYLAGDIHAM